MRGLGGGRRGGGGIKTGQKRNLGSCIRQEDETGESFLFVDIKEDSSHKKFDS